MELQNIIETMTEYIMDISENFYRQHNKEAYSKLDELYMQFDLLLNNEMVMKNDILKSNVIDISRFLNNIMEALKEQDGVLIADILRFDIGNSILNMIDEIGE